MPGDNLWSNSATGDSGSLGDLLQRLSCENCKLCEWAYILVALPFLVGGNSHLYLLLLLLLLSLFFSGMQAMFVKCSLEQSIWFILMH